MLRLAVADGSREAVERFSRELMPLVTAGPAGTTGYAEGRPRIHPLFRFWPCLFSRDRVQARIEILTLPATAAESSLGSKAAAHKSPLSPVSAANHKATVANRAVPSSRSGHPRRLADLARARSGDKGIHANIGVIARSPMTILGFAVI